MGGQLGRASASPAARAFTKLIDDEFVFLRETAIFRSPDTLNYGLFHQSQSTKLRQNL
jgi:hypothetical protein